MYLKWTRLLKACNQNSNPKMFPVTVNEVLPVVLGPFNNGVCSRMTKTLTDWNCISDF